MSQCQMTPDWAAHQRAQEDAQASIDPTAFFGCDPTYGNASLAEEVTTSEEPAMSLDPSDQVCEQPPDWSEDVEAGVCEQPQESLPSVDMSEGGECVEISEPTTVRSRMGDVAVYPDDFVGPLPEGAVRASHFDQMLDLYERIEDGQSQLSVDTSSFTAGIDPATDPEGYAAAVAQAEQFRAQTMGHLGALMRTDVGLQFLGELDTADHSVTIQNSTEGNYTDAADEANRGDRGNGVGTDTVVGMNYGLSTYQRPGEDAEGWMDERQRYGLYHELVHAYHNVNGTRADGTSTVQRHDDPSTTRELNNSELQAMGFGEYSDNEYTDNVFRQAMGKEQRPHYGGWVPTP